MGASPRYECNRQHGRRLKGVASHSSVLAVGTSVSIGKMRLSRPVPPSTSKLVLLTSTVGTSGRGLVRGPLCSIQYGIAAINRGAPGSLAGRAVALWCQAPGPSRSSEAWLLSGTQKLRPTISAKIITEMRGVDFIVFRIN